MATDATEKKNFKERFKSFQEKHNKQTDLHPKINLAILLIFPLFICSMAEINQYKGILPYLSFWVNHPTVMLVFTCTFPFRVDFNCSTKCCIYGTEYYRTI